MNKNLSQSEQKQRVAEYAIDRLIEKGLLFSGMKLGMGTGSTVMPAINVSCKKNFLRNSFRYKNSANEFSNANCL